MTCAGSVRLIEKLIEQGIIPADSSSGAADEGTAAHQVRGDALELGLDAWDFVGSSLTINGVEYPCTEEMAAYLQPGIDWIREQPGQLVVEHRVDLGEWLPGQFGTLDTAIIQVIDRRLIVNDLKYGAGVVVAALNNRQLRIYALGVWHNIARHLADIETITIVIDQPRAGGLKFWDITIKELLAFGEEVRAAGLMVDDPNAPLVPSEKGCQFCDVRRSPDGCGAYDRWMRDLFVDAFDDLDATPVFQDVERMTPELRSHIVRHADMARRWLADLHEVALDRARSGNPDPGLKAVKGQKGDRKYGDEDEAKKILVEALQEDAYVKKLKSPAQAEKDLKPGRKKIGNAKAWADLNKIIVQSEGKPILVPVEDDRPALKPLVDEFDDLMG